MASNPPDVCCTLGHLHQGDPTGKEFTIADGIQVYLATPPAGQEHKSAGILFLPDVIGIYPNSRLLADAYAREGYLTLLVDLFNGDPLSLNRPPDFDIQVWLAQGSDGKNPHTAAYVDPIVRSGIQYLQAQGITKIGAVGYCFGAKYVIRHYQSGIKVGFSAHPSFIDEDELAAITGPFAIAAAETDAIFPTDKRHRSEEILLQTKQPYQINLYSGVVHGFAVRGNLAVKSERYAKEQAFKQAVVWFDNFLL